jgi:hypothetical protein
MFIQIVSALASFFTLKKLGDYLFPREMTNIYLKAGFYSLKLYTPLYMTWEQLYTAYKAFLLDRSLDATSSLLYIHNGKVMNELTYNNMNIPPTVFNYYDLVLCKELLPARITDKKTYYNYKYHITRLNKDTDLANLPQPSTVRFLDIMVLMNQEKYTIDFGINNFYIAGNILFDKVFIQWYLTTFFNVDLIDTYTCIIMDQNVNLITLDVTNYILLAMDSYSIVEANVITL